MPPEKLLKLSAMKAAAQNTEALVLMGAATSKTAALMRSRNEPLWGDNTKLVPYMHASENEKQVYLQGGKICALTSQRLVEIT